MAQVAALHSRRVCDTCVVLPTLGLFKPNMAGGDIIGMLVLEFWCAYFLPVCILAYRFFKRVSNKSTE